MRPYPEAPGDMHEGFSEERTPELMLVREVRLSHMDETWETGHWRCKALRHGRAGKDLWGRGWNICWDLESERKSDI